MQWERGVKGWFCIVSSSYLYRSKCANLEGWIHLIDWIVTDPFQKPPKTDSAFKTVFRRIRNPKVYWLHKSSRRGISWGTMNWLLQLHERINSNIPLYFTPSLSLSITVSVVYLSIYGDGVIGEVKITGVSVLSNIWQFQHSVFLYCIEAFIQCLNSWQVTKRKE